MGTVQLTDLQLKSEALFELNLPIEVVKGTVGKVSIDIPWTTLYADPILVHLEDILILAAPVTEHQYDAELEKRLMRARKQKILEDVKGNQSFHTLFDNVAVKSRGFFENLLATIVNNVQISMQNVHIRYEDTVARNDGYAICCGIAFQSLTAITTNHKWKPTQIDSNSPNIFKLIKLETFYAYFNPRVDQQRLAKIDIKSIHWTSLMKTSIFNCSLCEEEFDFVLKPIIAKVKLIFNKSKEQRVPKLLVDCVLEDTSIEVSQSQYISILQVVDNFMRIEINRKYMKYKTSDVSTSSKSGLRALWKFGYNAIIEEYVRPYSWSRIKTHRDHYRKYKSLYKQRLLKPADAELKVDLQIAEDLLDICSILIAQEDAKLEIAKEEPDCVESIADTVDFCGSSRVLKLLGLGSKKRNNAAVISIKSERENLWSKFSAEEKEKVNEMMSSFDDTSPKEEPNVDIDIYIAHKINVTLANITVSLINGTHNGDRKEILVASLNQLLASFETRPSANGYKLSVRAETFIVEGVAGGSSHYEIIPIITADKSITTSSNVNSNVNANHKTHIFAIDVEKNPTNVKARYSITGQVEPIEVLYQHQSYVELMRFFFDVPMFDAFTKSKELKTLVRDTIERTSRLSRKRLLQFVFEKQSLIYWNVDLKSPYFVIPEYCAIERSGRVLVVDFGRLLIKSDLQQKSAILDKTNATASEMEEKLYDRISITLSDVQILFSDTGDEWRVAKELPESDVHLMPRLHVHFVCSHSLRPDYLMAPKYKLNVTVAALKFNFSDKRIRNLCDFVLKAPLPIFNQETVIVHEIDSVESKLNIVVPLFDLDQRWIQRDVNASELNAIRFALSSIPVTDEEDGSLFDGSHSHPSSVEVVVDTCSISQKTADNLDDEYYSASDISECDDSELVSRVRTIDLPGFDDNVSPSNVIVVMIRFTIGEVFIQLSRSSDVCDKPYLMLRVEKLNIDLSLMTYGPALQASLRRIQLVDKQQSSLTGGYLELLNSSSETEMITILYRKVKATCPDFKTHFHQVEHSLIIDLNALSITFHRESLITMARYITYVIDSIPTQLLTRIKSKVNSVIPDSPSSLMLIRNQSDPPIPAGATKYSFSTHLSRIDVHLCETELNFAKIEITGLEFDYVQKANEKYVIRMDLSQLNIFDESEDTLYQKIFYMENDEKIFDFKYVRKSPQVMEQSNLNTKGAEDTVDSETASDGSLRLHVGHIQFVLLLKFIVNFYQFLTPFIQLQSFRSNLKETATKNIQESVEKVADRKTRLKLNINIKSPTVIIPQKANSPNVIVCNIGDLTIENFFSSMTLDSMPNAIQLTDNMLMRLNGFHVFRRSMQIATDGSVVMDNADDNSYILQPLDVRVDLKQALRPRVHSIEVIAMDISAEVDSVKVNISETDLTVCFAIYQENIDEELQRLKTIGENSPESISPLTPEKSVVNKNETQTSDDSALAHFLSFTPEGFKDKCFRFVVEGVEIVFSTNSTQQSAAHSLSPMCRFTIDDISLFFCLFLNKSYEAKFSLQSFTIEDLRKESTSYLKTILQALSSSSSASPEQKDSIKSPPMFDLTYKGSPNDGHVDVMVERTRFNLSVSSMSAIFKFIKNLIPSFNNV